MRLMGSAPQSSAQEAADSPGAQWPSPHTPVQSVGQLERSHAVQSPSPHACAQSAEQEATDSVTAHWPSPQVT